MSDEAQLQVTRKDDESWLVLSSARSSLVARGRRDAATLAVPCNKCGERKELVFAGCVCASCSDAFDREWAAAPVTTWLVTRPWSDSRVSDFILLNTTYAQMKTSAWAANDSESRVRGFFRIRHATPADIAHLKFPSGIWSPFSGARAVRRATSEEVAALEKSNREWAIATHTDRLIGETCARLGIGELGEPQRVEQAAEEISERLRQLGWLEELARMKRDESDALQAIDDVRLLEMALAVRK
jgi:hypothetical protein